MVRCLRSFLKCTAISKCLLIAELRVRIPFRTLPYSVIRFLAVHVHCCSVSICPPSPDYSLSHTCSFSPSFPDPVMWGAARLMSEIWGIGRYEIDMGGGRRSRVKENQITRGSYDRDKRKEHGVRGKSRSPRCSQKTNIASLHRAINIKNAVSVTYKCGRDEI